MSATTCICTPAPPPNDHLQVVNPKCLAHRMDIQLVAAGWKRSGGAWWDGNGYYKGLFTIEQAFETLSVRPASDVEEERLP